MPRRGRAATGGYVYHVLNRGVRRCTLMATDREFGDFVSLVCEALQHRPMRLLAYSAMHTHFHLVVWPDKDDDLPQFMQWLTGTHARRWHAHHGTAGTGAVYQSRYKAIPVAADRHFLMLCRYVERNALRAGLVARAEDWPWSSLAGRCDPALAAVLDEWPVSRPLTWTEYVNDPQSPRELAALQEAVRRNLPFGSPEWQIRTAHALGLDQHFRDPGRPRRNGTAVGALVPRQVD